MVIVDDCMMVDVLVMVMMVGGLEVGDFLVKNVKVDVLWIVGWNDDIVFLYIKGFLFVFEIEMFEDLVMIWFMFGVILIIFVVVFIGMLVGVIFSNCCIKGFCGGFVVFKDGDGKLLCEICES